MTLPEFSTAYLEPFNVGRTTSRLLFDFGVMLSCFSTAENKRVLDFGSGTGWISEFLNRLGYEVYSLDIDLGMPETIQSRILADKRINPAGISPIIGNGMALPFPNDFFSHICCFDTLHHMNDYNLTFQELFRVLEPAGRAVFIEPGAGHSASNETKKFIQTYKTDDPTWIERDVILEEIADLSKSCGFSEIIVQPTLLPQLRSYTLSQWNEFRQGDNGLITEYLSLLKDFNYNDHLSFYCEKPDPMRISANEIDNLADMDSIIASLAGLKIVVDLTPMLPGADNGGAKLMTLQLVREIAKLTPQTTFLLLTADYSHAELDEIDNQFDNIQRLCVLQTANIQVASQSSKVNWRDATMDITKGIMRRILPFSVKERIKRWINRSQPVPGSTHLIRQIGADMLFCPFTAPFYADIYIPTVSIIYDLQFRTYPQFFSPEDLQQRKLAYKTAYQKADHLVAISEYVRKTVIETSGLSPENVSAVQIGLFRGINKEDIVENASIILTTLNLKKGNYLFYPANFWEHKNHAMLFTAFNKYKQEHPDFNLKLVCTGAPGASAEQIGNMADRMGLSDEVIFAGFVSNMEYDCLLSCAFALIFPSLYEGYGIPVLEAMAAGVPVLCSNVTSLPEVGGEAVLYFDPRKPQEICDALKKITTQDGLREQLISNGIQRAQYFKGFGRMAKEYLTIFSKVMNVQHKDNISGIYEDHWSTEQLDIRFSSTKEGSSRTLLIGFSNPDWRNKAVTIRTIYKERTLISQKKLKPGDKSELEISLPDEGGIMKFIITPTFIPEQLGIGNDNRELGLICLYCKINDSDGTTNLLMKD